MNYRNPRLLESGFIDCEIEHEIYGWIPFTCSLDDPGASFDTAALFEEMLPHAEPYIPPSEEELNQLRSVYLRDTRDQKLRDEVDPIAGNALRWGSLTAEKQQEWAVYRQALLDITRHANWPNLDEADWPTAP